METIEQVNEEFNVKKPKKKGLIIGLILAVAIVISFVLVYFLVLTNPKFVFSKTIDKIFAVDSQKHESVKIDTKMKASVELKDTTYQAQAEEIEKYAIKLGAQMDAENKQEIVDLGLEYDNEAVIDAQVYYNDGEIYTYFEGIFDKYIELDMDEETKAQLDEIFETVASEENLKNSEKAIAIVRDELKEQIKAEGKFEKEKTTIDVGEDEEKVTKSTLILSEKQLWNVAENIFTNLADNEEFLDCFKDKTIDEDLKELVELMEENETDGKSNVKISIYTKGLLNNKLVAVDMQVYVESEETTITMAVVKEDEDIYSYNVSGKSNGIKIDVVKGTVEIEKDKDSKKEQSGKVSITAEVIELGNAKLEIDYSVEYDQGIDKIDTSNSVNMNDLTESDMQSIMTKLMERPLIGELITNEMNGIGSETEKNDIITNNTENNLTTTQNEVKDEDYGYSVTYSVPAGFEYDGDFSYDDMKFYELENVDDSYIDATVTLDWDTEDEYIEGINSDYKYYTEEAEFYTAENLSEIKTIVIGDKIFKYQIMSYKWSAGNDNSTNQKAYVWYAVDSEYLFTIELDSTETEITEDIIKGFLNINVTKLN